MNRRQFLSKSFFFGSSFYFLPAYAQKNAPEKSRVIRTGQTPSAKTGNPLNFSRVKDLLDEGMCNLIPSEDPVEPWKRLFNKNETIGLKVNCLSGAGSTHPVLVEAITERLKEAGISDKNIIIWDRLSSDLEDGGFRIRDNRNKVRVIGNDILGFENELSLYGAAASRICRILTRECDAIINIPLLKDHSIAGMTMSLKNMFGAIHNPHKYHLNAGDPYIADINAFPEIRRKIRLHICDALEAQYEGGPSFMPHWRWRMGSLLISRDPVALDYTGWQIIDQKRKEMGLATLKESGREPKYITTAADGNHRLGTNDPARIDYSDI